MRYLWDVCNEDKCCVVTQRAGDIRFAWLVCVCMYFMPTATLNQKKRTRLLYLGDAQRKKSLEQKSVTKKSFEMKL